MKLPEPVAWIAVNKSYEERRAELTFYPKSSWFNNHEIEPLYTAAQMREYRNAALEDAAKVCAAKSPAEYATGKVDHNEMAWVDSCAFDIRKLKEVQS